MNKTPRTDYYWRKINQDNIDGYGLALRMRDHAYKLEEKMTDLMEWRIEIENTLHNVAEERDSLKDALRKAISWGESASHHILYRQNINWTYLNEAKEVFESFKSNSDE